MAATSTSSITRGLAAGMVLAAALAAPAAAQDTVYLSSDSSDRGYTKVVGQVIDYTGRALQVQTSGGSQQTFPSGRVLRIDTRYGPQQAEADRRFAERDFASASALYEKARSAEPRAWVRRQITAQLVWCYQALGQPERAGEEFLLLIRGDPVTIHFGCIPLAWISSAPSVLVEQAARQWLTRDEPAAVLLGASHLLATSSRSQALEKLGQLTTEADRRIALLALAQTWRAAVVTAKQQQLHGWEETIERMPEPLRAGPYYVLGLAWAHRQTWDEAALAWLRIPILYSEHRALAARSLLDAGRSLEQLDRSEQATHLYTELLKTYPESPPVAEARARLEEIATNPN